MAVYHVYPVNDIKEHCVEEGCQCACNPDLKIIEDTGDMMYVHHSWDGREVIEELIQEFIDTANPN